MSRYILKNGYDVRKVYKNGNSFVVGLPKNWVESTYYTIHYFTTEDLDSEAFRQVIEKAKQLEASIIILVPVK